MSFDDALEVPDAKSSRSTSATAKPWRCQLRDAGDDGPPADDEQVDRETAAARGGSHASPPPAADTTGCRSEARHPDSNRDLHYGWIPEPASRRSRPLARSEAVRTMVHAMPRRRFRSPCRRDSPSLAAASSCRGAGWGVDLDSMSERELERLFAGLLKLATLPDEDFTPWLGACRRASRSPRASNNSRA